jgi:hypothetical protein
MSGEDAYETLRRQYFNEGFEQGLKDVEARVAAVVVIGEGGVSVSRRGTTRRWADRTRSACRTGC